MTKLVLLKTGSTAVVDRCEITARGGVEAEVELTPDQTERLRGRRRELIVTRGKGRGAARFELGDERFGV